MILVPVVLDHSSAVTVISVLCIEVMGIETCCREKEHGTDAAGFVFMYQLIGQVDETIYQIEEFWSSVSFVHGSFQRIRARRRGFGKPTCLPFLRMLCQQPVGSY